MGSYNKGVKFIMGERTKRERVGKLKGVGHNPHGLNLILPKYRTNRGVKRVLAKIESTSCCAPSI